MRYKKGERTVSLEEIKTVLAEEGIATANTIATRLGRHFNTIQRRCEELFEGGYIDRVQYVPNKYKMRLYKLRENEPVNTDNETQ
jgi:DNA-binding Lrp family transcriptional regulator